MLCIRDVFNSVLGGCSVTDNSRDDDNGGGRIVVIGVITGYRKACKLKDSLRHKTAAIPSDTPIIKKTKLYPLFMFLYKGPKNDIETFWDDLCIICQLSIGVQNDRAGDEQEASSFYSPNLKLVYVATTAFILRLSHALYFYTPSLYLF